MAGVEPASITSSVGASIFQKESVWGLLREEKEQQADSADVISLLLPLGTSWPYLSFPQGKGMNAETDILG